MMETAKEFIDWFLANPQSSMDEAIAKSRELPTHERIKLRTAINEVVNVKSTNQ